MVGLVIAAHGRLAQELLATAEQIVGPLAKTIAVTMAPGCDPDGVRAGIADAVREVDDGSGVVVLTDLFGGTPCKESLLLLASHTLEVIAGVNLPMVLKAASLRQQPRPLPELAEAIVEETRRHITYASAMLRAREKDLS